MTKFTPKGGITYTKQSPQQIKIAELRLNLYFYIGAFIFVMSFYIYSANILYNLTHSLLGGLSFLLIEIISFSLFFMIIVLLSKYKLVRNNIKIILKYSILLFLLSTPINYIIFNTLENTISQKYNLTYREENNQICYYKLNGKKEKIKCIKGTIKKDTFNFINKKD